MRLVSIEAIHGQTIHENGVNGAVDKTKSDTHDSTVVNGDIPDLRS